MKKTNGIWYLKTLVWLLWLLFIVRRLLKQCMVLNLYHGVVLLILELIFMTLVEHATCKAKVIRLWQVSIPVDVLYLLKFWPAPVNQSTTYYITNTVTLNILIFSYKYLLKILVLYYRQIVYWIIKRNWILAKINVYIFSFICFFFYLQVFTIKKKNHK